MTTVYPDPSASAATVASAQFRGLMASFPTGVAVVSAFGADGRPRGMTCSSVCSVSLDPPVLLVCIRQGSPTLEAVRLRSAFALNLLHADAQPTAVLFASGTPERFGRIRWHTTRGGAGPHLPDDAHAIADCRVTRCQPIGDHTVVFGEATRVLQGPARSPLLYGLRRYAVWPDGG